MSHGYVPVQWNPQKRRYDAAIAGLVALYLGLFIGLGAALFPDATAETLIIRACGTGALSLLHLILCIGPLARLDRRFLILLYNRRHLGVSMFLLAAVHGVFSLIQFHALGDLNPLVSLLVSTPRFDSVSQLSFQPLGAAALLILYVMAATSHDFWLKQLTAPVWKALHMGVYLAYALVVLHVALGALQAVSSPVWLGLLNLGVVGIAGLHLAAARREAPLDDAPAPTPGEEGFVEVCGVDEIPELRARVVRLGGERVAVFRYEGRVSAVSNVCQHQSGPLGEGRVIDGCITCPWHGFQYHPDTGASPPPFTEKVPTFRVKLRDGRVWVHPTPLAAGTRVEPARIDGAVAEGGARA